MHRHYKPKKNKKTPKTIKRTGNISFCQINKSSKMRTNVQESYNITLIKKSTVLSATTFPKKIFFSTLSILLISLAAAAYWRNSKNRACLHEPSTCLSLTREKSPRIARKLFISGWRCTPQYSLKSEICYF